MPELTVGEIQKDISALQWERQKRNFKNDLNDLQKVYWNCITADILTLDSLKTTDDELEWFSRRFRKSLLGCFYSPVELYYYVLEKIDGYFAYYRWEKEEWEKWQNQLRVKQLEIIGQITNAINKNIAYEEQIISQTHFKVSYLRQFDHYQKVLEEPISNLLWPHIREAVKRGEYIRPINNLEGYEFFYSIQSVLLEQLHEWGVAYLKAAMPYFAIQDISKRLKEINRVHILKKLPPSKAVQDCLKTYPDLKEKGVSTIAYYVRLLYRDESGNDLKLDSIKNAISEENK